MRNGGRILTVGMLLVLPGLALAAPAVRPAVAPDTVVIGTQQEPAVIALAICDACTMFVATMVSQPIMLPTVEMTDEWKFQPVAVEKLPSLKDGDWKLLPNNKMQVTWRIRRGLKWQDGRSLTAEDWIFAWRVNMNPRFPSAGRDVAERVENILAPNPYTMVVQWKKKYAFADLNVNGAGYLPRHILSRCLPAGPFQAAPAAVGDL
jgi:ABC-type transport system substrate-binding protein